MIEQINFNGSIFGINRLNSDRKNQINNLKGGPKYITFNSEMKKLTNSKLDFWFIFLPGNFDFQIAFLFQFNGIVSSKK